MKAFVLERYGKKRALRLADMPDPEPRDDEVLVKVHAAGVNQQDSKIRDGEFKLVLPYRLPLVLGHDVAGVVVKLGARVRQFKPGDEVYARPDDLRIGTFAEFVPVKEASLALKPQGLTMEQAASIPLVGLTAWQALVEKARLKKGQKVFIQAGSGGVGTFAIQLACVIRIHRFNYDGVDEGRSAAAPEVDSDVRSQRRRRSGLPSRGISRPTLRKWLRRYEALGVDGLESQSRRPHRSPGQK